MRASLSLIALSLLLLTLSIFCVGQMLHTMDDLISMTEHTLQALPEDHAAAQKTLERFAQQWNRIQPYWQLFLLHEDLDAVTLALQQAMNAESSENVAEACCELLSILKTMKRKEIPSIGNIF